MKTIRFTTQHHTLIVGDFPKEEMNKINSDIQFIVEDKENYTQDVTITMNVSENITDECLLTLAYELGACVNSFGQLYHIENSTKDK